jgi:hypothetical protein
MTKILLSLSLLSLVALSGCSLDDLIGGGTKMIEGVGTVMFIDLEGGFYGLEMDNGARYQPLNLAAEFQQDGLRVNFKAMVADDVTTIQQWGTPIDVLEMQRM